MIAIPKQLLQEETDMLIKILKERFETNTNRHPNISWIQLQVRLEKNMEKLWSLNQMEQTGGQPDVIGYLSQTDEYIFCDCSEQSPIGRRNLCYDEQAFESRKEHKPKNSAIAMATAMGIKILTKEEYENLQKLGNFDTKTSSWILTPDTIRKLGGALFCDKRYGHIFMYHNGAESYYSSRGFRGLLYV